ncbi:MAG: YibE/F family protein [Bacillota bacterium]|nr:YibE/F family protein [Bacillota bacterium]
MTHTSIKTENLICLFKNNKRNFIIVLCLIITSLFTLYFIWTNESYYNKVIAKITTITEQESQAQGMNGKLEPIKKQEIKAIIINGTLKGKEIKLENTTSYSGAYDLNLKVNDEVFVSIQQNNTPSYKILDVKRDKYTAYITILFILLILIIGGYKGFKSLTSVIINIIIFSLTILLFLRGYNLILVASTASILFITVSIALVNGINKKAISAVVGTLAGTIFTMLITAAVIKLTHSNGIHYEEMEFLTHPPEQIFFIEIMIGTLGAIMDIAISISSAINEIYDKNPYIENKVLVDSAREIGKDIMGTMSNTLVFAYISGSIPMILLLLKNDFPFFYIIHVNLSLEIIRALTGSIGIVISIPITIYTSVFLVKKHKIGEVSNQ